MPVPAIKLSRRAEADLAALYDYGFEKFGRRAADGYTEKLLATLDLLASNPRLSPIYLTGKAIRRHKFKRHIIYYKARSNSILIFRILHVSMDPVRHL